MAEKIQTDTSPPVYTASRGDIITVGQLAGCWKLVTDPQETQSIRDRYPFAAGGQPNIYDSFFVLTNDGDYWRIFGMAGDVPYLSKLITRVL